MSWQSIETAPKDGTLVDLWSKTMKRLTNVHYSKVTYAPGVDWGWTNGKLGRIMDATHWMPLPEPPADRQE